MKTYPMNMPVDVDIAVCVIPYLTHCIFHLLPVIALFLSCFYSLSSDCGEIEPFVSYCSLSIKMKKLIWLNRSHTSIYTYSSKCPKRRKHFGNAISVIFQHMIHSSYRFRTAFNKNKYNISSEPPRPFPCQNVCVLCSISQTPTNLVI